MNGSVVGVLTEIQKDFGYAVPSSITQIALKGWGVQIEQAIRQSDQVVLSDSGKSDGKTAALPQEITGKDGAPMVLVPAGEFLAWQLEVRPGLERQNVWYEVEAPHRLIRWDLEPRRYRLREVVTDPDGSGS